jgi:hypothetical protein
MGSKPIAEGGHKGWTGGGILNWFARANPERNEVMTEELRSEVLMVTYPAALEMRAAATAKMAAEGLKHAEIDVLQNAAFPLNEAAEMGGRSNVSNGAGWRVSVSFEVICKRIDVWSTDSRTQAPQRFGRGEVLFDHGLSLLIIGQ